MEIIKANPEEVKALLDHLVKAFEGFYQNREKELDYRDAFIAIHNFHTVIILDIESRHKWNAETQLFFRKMAVDAFVKAMESKPAFRRNDGY